MLKYLIIFNIITALSFGTRKYFKSFSFILVIIFIFVCGLRIKAVDLGNYHRYYDNISSSTSIGLLKAESKTNTASKIESFFAILAIIEKKFCGSFEFFIFIYAFISISIKFKAFKKLSPYIFLTLLLYCSNYYFKDLGQMRNAMASGIILLALLYAEEKKPINFYSLIYLSMINHTMGVIGLPIYFYKKFTTKKILIGLLLVAFILQFSLGGLKDIITLFSLTLDIESDRIAGRVLNNSKYMIESSYLSVSNIIFISIAIYLIIRLKTLRKCSKYSEVLIFTFIYGLSSFFLFHDIAILASRFIDTLCVPVLCVLLPIIAKSYTGLKRNMVIVLIFLYSFYSLVIANYETIINYQSLI